MSIRQVVLGVAKPDAILLRQVHAANVEIAIHILPEVGALVLHLQKASANATWGLIFRRATPCGPHLEEIHAMIPLFSLWSIDRLQCFEPTLMQQLYVAHGQSLHDLVLSRIILPLIDAYFGLITRLGLQVELNSQNILIGFNTELAPVAVIFRDLNGVEKDLSLHKTLGLNTEYESSPYKEISRESDSESYAIRHSFTFDFKLSHYVLLPIVTALADVMRAEYGPVIETIRSHVRHWLPQLPDDYFPPGNMWYAHEDIDLSRERPYIARPQPHFR